MRLTPIEEMRARLNRVVGSNGPRSPRAQRISRVLDHLLTEWYQVAPASVLAAQALHPPQLRDREELVRLFERAMERNDWPGVASLLALVLALPRHDPDRPKMLNCCGYIACAIAEQTVPSIAVTALEEAAATAPPFSMLHLKAQGNLAFCYLRQGRVTAAYLMLRRLVRTLDQYEADTRLRWITYVQLGRAARWLNKERLARFACKAALALRLDEHHDRMVEIALFSLDSPRATLLEMKRRFQRLYPQSPAEFQGHLVGSYAAALLRHGYLRGALAAARYALRRIQRDQPRDRLSLVELHLIMAAAARLLGEERAAQGLVHQAQELLGPAALLRPATLRVGDWLALVGQAATSAERRPAGVGHADR
jgi:hypothetical protein